jgi:hypothetical protein
MEQRSEMMRLLLTQNTKRNTQHFLSVLCALCSLLILCLFSAPCFAQGVLAQPITRLPSLPDLPSGEKIYDAGGASPDQPKELDLDSVSRPIDTQGELKMGANGVVKANKYKIGYGENKKRIESKINDKTGRTKQENLGSDSYEQDLAQTTPPVPSRKPDLGFLYYQTRELGQIGFDALVRKPNEQTQE